MKLLNGRTKRRANAPSMRRKIAAIKSCGTVGRTKASKAGYSTGHTNIRTDNNTAISTLRTGIGSHLETDHEYADREVPRRGGGGPPEGRSAAITVLDDVLVIARTPRHGRTEVVSTVAKPRANVTTGMGISHNTRRTSLEPLYKPRPHGPGHREETTNTS